MLSSNVGSLLSKNKKLTDLIEDYWKESDDINVAATDSNNIDDSLDLSESLDIVDNFHSVNSVAHNNTPKSSSNSIRDHVEPRSTSSESNTSPMNASYSDDESSIEHNDIYVKGTSILKNQEDTRLTTYPITRHNIWKLYETAQKSFWVPGEIDMTNDVAQWSRIETEHEYGKQIKHIVEQVLAFFAVSDGIVNQNLSSNFSCEVPIVEVEYFYRFQQMMEDIHAITYSNMIKCLIGHDTNKTNFLLESINNIPATREKVTWAINWMRSNEYSFEQRLLAFSIVEGVFFSGSFCIIYWLGSLNLFPGLLQANKLISRDERLHVEHAVELYKMCTKRVEYNVWASMLMDAVRVESIFIDSLLPEPLPSMNVELLNRHIKHVANRLSVQNGYPLVYPEVSNTPFEFELMRDIETAACFFEQKVTEYQKYRFNNDEESDSESI